MKLKKIPKYCEEFFEELGDALEDIADFFTKKPKKKIKKLKKAELYGATVSVRPAYLFAERVESFIKLIFGFSIVVTGLSAAVWGITRTSELIDSLISSWWGRLIIIIVGVSYFIIGSWKLANIHVREKKK